MLAQAMAVLPQAQQPQVSSTQSLSCRPALAFDAGFLQYELS